MNDSKNLVYCWSELNKLLDYLLCSCYSDEEKVKRAKAVAFDICVKFGKSYENENR